MYATCAAHDYPHQNCSACQGSRYTLTGLQRTYLETVRDRITADDKADPYDFASELDADGMVTFRPATLSDHIEWAAARWVFEDALERQRGEVRADD